MVQEQTGHRRLPGPPGTVASALVVSGQKEQARQMGPQNLGLRALVSWALASQELQAQQRDRLDQRLVLQAQVASVTMGRAQALPVPQMGLQVLGWSWPVLREQAQQTDQLPPAVPRPVVVLEWPAGQTGLPPLVGALGQESWERAAREPVLEVHPLAVVELQTDQPTRPAAARPEPVWAAGPVPAASPPLAAARRPVAEQMDPLHPARFGPPVLALEARSPAGHPIPSAAIVHNVRVPGHSSSYELPGVLRVDIPPTWTVPSLESVPGLFRSDKPRPPAIPGELPPECPISPRPDDQIGPGSKPGNNRLADHDCRCRSRHSATRRPCDSSQ